MLPIIEHLQTVNRGLLNRLRPMALGHVPLGDLIERLVQDRAREHPQINFRLDAATLARTYGDTIDLTIYRCVQESLTNAIRHAAATQIVVAVGEPSGDASQLVLKIEDDGHGIGSRRAARPWPHRHGGAGPRVGRSIRRSSRVPVAAL